MLAACTSADTKVLTCQRSLDLPRLTRYARERVKPRRVELAACYFIFAYLGLDEAVFETVDIRLTSEAEHSLLALTDFTMLLTFYFFACNWSN
jgi:hypothetical protein